MSGEGGYWKAIVYSARGEMGKEDGGSKRQVAGLYTGSTGRDRQGGADTEG